MTFLKIGESIKYLFRQLVDIDKVQFGFMSGCAITNSIVILRDLKDEYLAIKKHLYFLAKDLGQVPEDVFGEF